MTSPIQLMLRPRRARMASRVPNHLGARVGRALRPRVVLAALVCSAGLADAVPALAQVEVEERWPGVSLGLSYETRPLPVIGVHPFTGSATTEEMATRVGNIIARDLGYSNRFRVLDAIPSQLARGEVDYALWDELRVTWLVTGRLEGSGSSAVLILELHDVVYREVRERARLPIPGVDSPDFRLAAHLASDAIVQWVFGEPGMAASRIAFGRSTEDGETQDIWVIDSDGESLRRLTRRQATQLGDPITMSPAFSPDGTRIAYISWKDLGLPRVYELDLGTGEERMLPAPRDGDYSTPTYHPDGERLFFAIFGGNENGIYSYNVVRDCCFTNITLGSRNEDLSPSFSPDGATIVFNSNRLGSGSPQIYLMPAEGSSRPDLFSPWVYDRPGYYTSPDWSPLGDKIAFHGRVEQRGVHQVLVAELDSRGRSQKLVLHTSEGVNEDPSFAPDGRHIVYTGERDWGYGLFVTDLVTGGTRTLVSGMNVKNPEWSPQLALP